MSMVGQKMHVLVRDLFTLLKLQMQKLKDIYKELCEHLGLKLVVIAERFYFYQRSQGLDESVAQYVAEYVAELRCRSTNCKFGDFLNDVLHDRFVCGLQNRATQKSLLSENNLSLKKAIDVEQSAKAAESHTTKLSKGENNLTVHRTESTKETRLD